jgi:hypothetical protein
MIDLKNKLKFPLIVVDDLDISLCNSIEALETHLEGIDVAENRYKSFDAEGRLLELKAIGAKKGLFTVIVGRVQLADAEDIPRHREELAEYLRHHLKAVGQPIHEEMDLSQLVQICAKRQMEDK